MDWIQLCALCACLWTQTFATPPSGYVKPPDTDKNPPKYEFGYDVRDGQGGSQGHLETREGEYALGKYYVNLPRNEQKVDYFADDWGYHPLVEYRTSSASSSMSTQFALGEKAVAALSRQHGVAPPLEIFKTKKAKSLIAGVGAHVSIPGSSGIIPGPSDEPVHNYLEGDVYSSTSTTAAPSTYDDTHPPSTLRYESSHASSGVEFSTFAPNSYSAQTTGVQTLAQNYPVSSEEHSGTYLGASDSQSQHYYHGEPSGSGGYSTTENFNSYAAVSSEGLLQNEYESKQQNYYGEQVSSSPQEYSSSPAPNLQEYTTPSPRESYESSLRPSYSTSTQNYEQSSSYSEAQNGHQITSYLADSNAAVDVTSKGLSQGLPGVVDYSPNTRISAVLVAEGGNKFEENEIRHEYGNRYLSSTTPNPIKTLLKPIVVSDTNGVNAPLSLYSNYGSTSNEGYIDNKIGKLYHREGRLKSHGGYSSTSVSVQPNGQEYYSTPAPTLEPVLVTPRLESSKLTSSGNILAPIQAGLSISANHNVENCDENPTKYEVKENIPLSGPDIEKQELKEEAVYKTTVDIQKSIPFEIHPNEPYDQNSAEQHPSGPEEHAHQTAEYQTQYSDQSSNNLHSQAGNIHIDQNSQGEYEQAKQEENHVSVQSNYNAQASSGYTSLNTANDYSREVNAHYDNRNNFLQQVLFAYHKMANNHVPYVADGGGYQTGIPVQNKPLFVPNRLYYVYMQRFNPYANRYGTLYTNYSPPSTQAPVIPDAGSYTNGEFPSQVDQAGQYQGQRYLGEHNVNINSAGYNGYASQEGQHGQEITGTTSNIVYNNQVGGTRFSISSGQSAIEHVNTNYAPEVVDINLSPNYSDETNQPDSLQNSAQEYAAQLNGLSISSGVGGVVNSEEQHVQYSTDQGGERSEAIPGNYHQKESNSFQQVESIVAQSLQPRYTGESDNSFNQNTNVLIKEVPVPQYMETTKLVEVERPVPIPQPVPVEYTHIVEKPVPYVHEVPVHHTQYVEKPVPVPQPVPVEVTKIVEKPVPVPHPVPVEYTKVVAVEKPVAVPHPVPYAVTKLVAVDRPVAYPQPVPFPYPVPHPVGVPVPHLVPYPNLVPVPVKDYRPVYVYRKPSGSRLLHRDGNYHHPAKHSPVFRPSQPMFASQYPPQTYEVTAYFKGPHIKGRGHGRKLCIEYGGFKPPLVPSVQFEAESKPTYGPPAEEKKD